LLIAGLVSLATVCTASCGRPANAAQAPQNQGTQAPGASPQAAAFVQHPENIQPGLAAQGSWAALTNPYERDAQRRAEGAKLFVSYNCVDCHGADGSGAMGPSLQDNRWHFGGSAGEVFQSIYEGRPDGMPAWGGRIGDDQIWRLVTYVRALAQGHAVATENFTGKTVERSGR